MGQVEPETINETVDRNKADYNLFNRLKESGYSEAEICQWLGLMHIKKQNWERASTYFKKAVSMNSKLYLSWYNLGLLYIDTEEGNRYLKKAIEAEPDFPPPYYWLAYVYCKHKREKEAIKFFKQYIDLAEGIPIEEIRYKRAKQILTELFSGREGKELWKIRNLNW